MSLYTDVTFRGNRKELQKLKAVYLGCGVPRSALSQIVTVDKLRDSCMLKISGHTRLEAIAAGARAAKAEFDRLNACKS